MSERFSKASVAKAILRRIEYCQERDGFTTEIGYAQVIGKGEEKNRAYGAWAELQDLLEELEL